MFNGKVSEVKCSWGKSNRLACPTVKNAVKMHCNLRRVDKWC